VRQIQFNALEYCEKEVTHFRRIAPAKFSSTERKDCSSCRDRVRC
jgi:hypothetical protein